MFKKHRSIRSTAALLAVMACAMTTGMLMNNQTAPAAVESRENHHNVAPTTFAVDPVHSVVVFRVGHLGVAKFWGRFNQLSGSFTYDADEPGSSTFDFTVPTESVDTGNAGRDRHLKSPDFFNAREYPAITFKSTGITVAASANSWKVTGDLTLHGVTKSVTADIEWIGEGQTSQGHKRGFEAQFTIRRSEFGMNKYLEDDAIGDEVKLVVAIEGVNK